MKAANGFEWQDSAASVGRMIRIVTILSSCERVGLRSVNISILHTLAFLTDALAPVWNLPIIDAQVLKRRIRPFSPALQRDVDALVGPGLVIVDRFTYLRAEQSGEWFVDADYSLDGSLTLPVLEEINKHPEQAHKASFVQEVIYAASGLGVLGMADITQADATYSNPIVDFGGLIDMAGDAESTNPTADVARRFSVLAAEAGRVYSDAEMVHLYIRHLYGRMQVA